MTKLDNVEVFSVCIVGTIKSKEVHATNMVYSISDGTGIVDCKTFMDKDGVGMARFGDCQ